MNKYVNASKKDGSVEREIERERDREKMAKNKWSIHWHFDEKEELKTKRYNSV